MISAAQMKAEQVPAKQVLAKRVLLENAKKAKDLADELFPEEKWKIVEEGIYVSPQRAIGKNTNYVDELRDAQILRNLGHTVYLLSEPKTAVKKYDAIVSGLKFEFKNCGGNANTLITQFLKSRSQAPNVFINLETSHLTQREVLSALYGARNRKNHINNKGTLIKGYAENNKFSGGEIILKIKDQEDLIYLNVDDLEISEK